MYDLTEDIGEILYFPRTKEPPVSNLLFSNDNENFTKHLIY